LFIPCVFSPSPLLLLLPFPLVHVMHASVLFFLLFNLIFFFLPCLLSLSCAPTAKQLIKQDL
jgi:hypothetical protein